jgi:hypothetical protein
MWLRKWSLTHSHGKTSNDFDSVCSGHVFEEVVVSKSNAAAVL